MIGKNLQGSYDGPIWNKIDRIHSINSIYSTFSISQSCILLWVEEGLDNLKWLDILVFVQIFREIPALKKAGLVRRRLPTNSLWPRGNQSNQEAI